MKVFYFKFIIMDYEKKYKEALGRARIYRDNAKAVEEYSAVARYENIFPELCESNDERIRKYLIEELKAAKSVGELKFIIPQPTREECIAYLEKQKEQKPAVSREEILHQLLQNGSITLSDYLYLTEKQKPAEWSEEDESELTAVIYCVSRAIKASKDENERNSLLSAKKWLQDKLSLRVKSLRPSWKPSEEQMMENYPKWRRIKAGERLPCPAYVWTIAYDNYPDCFEGRLMPNIQGVKVGRDTWYLPVDVIHNLPKED